MTRATPTEGDRGDGRRLRTRARLIDVARRVVATSGIEATPISEITDEAGVSVGSFYNHFATKEDLLEATITETLEAHGMALDRIHEGKDDIAEMFAQNIRLTVRMADHDPTWGWFVVHTAMFPSGLQTSLGSRFARDLQRGFEAGRFASYDERTTVAAVGGALLGVMVGRLTGDLPNGADRFLAEELLRLLGLRREEAAEIAARRMPALKRLVAETAKATLPVPKEPEHKSHEGAETLRRHKERMS